MHPTECRDNSQSNSASALNLGGTSESIVGCDVGWAASVAVGGAVPESGRTLIDWASEPPPACVVLRTSDGTLTLG